MKHTVLTAVCLLLIGTGVLISGTVAEIEYYYDADPGYGNGTPIYSRNTVDINQLINTDALADGFHRIYVRAKNQDGLWGLPQNRTFYIPLPVQVTPPAYGTVSRIEYYFDADPGLGQGTPLYTRNTVSLDQLISTAVLEEGFHRLYVRAKNAAGQWGMPQKTTFFIPFPSSGPPPPYGTVARIEYYFDTDPGQGLGTQIYARNAVDINQLIATTSLEPGFHRIFVRAKSASGQWGMPQRYTFYIPLSIEPTGPYKNITHIEYFVDSDPGFGNGTVVSVPPGSNLNIDIPIDMSNVEHGNRTLYLRAKTSSGAWGFPAKALFSDGVPAYLTLNIVEGNLIITWEDLYTIDTYQVYSAPEPQAPYVLETGGSFGPSDWTGPLPTDPKRFYRVTSIYDEP
ncbi:MAG TPA: hypothetical protein PKH19_05365 [Candidatus Syntrophosphaera sp.]|nr:hypothetical protein [Candidatus Syntrophosphaera sp.]